jgi:hypothetical protein
VTSLLEAKKSFQAKDYVEALRLVRNTGEIHHRTHLPLLQWDTTKNGKSKEESQKIAAKQAKLQSVLDLFAAVVSQLEKLARVQPEKIVSPLAGKNRPADELLPLPPLSEEFREKFQAAANGEEQFRTLVEWFHTQPVASEKHLQLGALYGLRHQGQVHLLRYMKRNAAMATVAMEMVLSGKLLKPFPLEKVLEYGTKQLLHRLLPKTQPGASVEGDSSDDFTVAIINKGALTQLQMAAQSTGLLPNSDAIGFIRDHEFRLKKYQECFDRIEGLFVHLRTAADQRMQRLRQEEINYRSGYLKMSPKEWLMKQQRDTSQTQGILRTLRYFTKVLDGLRILQSNPQAAPRDE